MTQAWRYVNVGDEDSSEWIAQKTYIGDSFYDELFFRVIELVEEQNKQGYENKGFIAQVKELYEGLVEVYEGDKETQSE